MSKTREIVENFPPGTTEAQMEGEQKIRMKAGAVSSSYEGSEAEGWTLTTIRKIIG